VYGVIGLNHCNHDVARKLNRKGTTRERDDLLIGRRDRGQQAAYTGTVGYLAERKRLPEKITRQFRATLLGSLLTGIFLSFVTALTLYQLVTTANLLFLIYLGSIGV